MVSPRHKLHRKQQKKVHEYSHKLIDNFKLITLNPSPKLTDQEKRSIANYFGSSHQDQCIEDKTKMILTHILKRWNENKSSAHPSTFTLNPAETVAPKIY